MFSLPLLRRGSPLIPHDPFLVPTKAKEEKKRTNEPNRTAHLIIRRGRLKGTSNDEPHLGARLAQDGRHLLRAHAPQADLADLEDVVAALQPSVLKKEKKENAIRFPAQCIWRRQNEKKKLVQQSR